MPSGVTSIVGSAYESLVASRARYPALSAYVRRHAQALDEAVMRQHVDLYVNDFSLGLGEAGRRAVETLLRVWREQHPEAPAATDSVYGVP